MGLWLVCLFWGLLLVLWIWWWTWPYCLQLSFRATNVLGCSSGNGVLHGYFPRFEARHRHLLLWWELQGCRPLVGLFPSDLGPSLLCPFQGTARVAFFSWDRIVRWWLSHRAASLMGFGWWQACLDNIKEMLYCFSRSSVKFQGHTTLKITEFDPNWAFPDCNSSLNSPMATKWCTKLEVEWKRSPIVVQGYKSNCKVTRLKEIIDFDSNWPFPECNSTLNSPMAMKWCTRIEVA